MRLTATLLERRAPSRQVGSSLGQRVETVLGAPARRNAQPFKTTKQALLLAVATCLLTATSLHTQPIVTLTISTQPPSPAINPDFTGLSFEMQYVLPDSHGHHFFSPANHRLIATFKQLGIKSLRVGGNTADRPTLPTPSESDVDNLFAFARAAGVKVIYTLRLNAGDINAATRMANYITRHYPEQLDCFAIGNEPNVFSKQFAPYLEEWKRYATAIIAPTNSPNARFCGPSTSPGHESWAASFANAFGNHGTLSLVTQHDYPGGDARRATNATVACDKILSPAIDEHYAKFAANFVPAALSNALPYRLEEANSFYDGGAADVSDTLASALWALDYQWWWLTHGASGVNFHTGDKVAARDENKPCRYAVFWTVPDGYNIHPLGYALKLFSMGARGHLQTLEITNDDNLNVAAYAAVSNDHDLYITLINREHGDASRTAEFRLSTGRIKSAKTQCRLIRLGAPENDVAAKSYVTLGGAEIQNDGTWNGKWTTLSRPDRGGTLSIQLPPASAALVEIK